MVLTQMGTFVKSNGTGPIATFLPLMIEIMLDEVTELDQDTMAVYLEQMGSVIQWIGSGDVSVLPERLRSQAESISLK